MPPGCRIKQDGSGIAAQIAEQPGDFFKSSGVERIPGQILPRRKEPLINTVFWTALVLTPMLYYLAGLVFTGQIFHLAIVGVVMSVFYYLMTRAINESKIKLGSRYGADKRKAQ